MTYTPRGDLATVTYSGSSAPPVSYTYDADGNKTSMSDGTGTSSYSYDPFGELTSATNGAGQNTGYSYNADGQITSIAYPLPPAASWALGNTVGYTYDGAGLLTKVTDFNGNPMAITSNPDGLADSETLGTTGDTVTTSYDNTDSPSSISLTNSVATLQSFSYQYAPDQSILRETDTPSSPRTPAVTATTPKAASPR